MYSKFGQFIDGKWQQAEKGETYEVVNPATEEIIGKASKASSLDVQKALKSAEKGLEIWKNTAPWQRSYIIRKIADLLREKKKVMAKWLTLEVGKPLLEGEGETNGDRASLLEVLSNMNPHPESVPINSLVAIEGTGLEDNQDIDSIEMIRMIATARILMPKSKIRLSAGREKLSKEAQILCFQCGANSIFYGDELLTTSNPSFQSDRKLLKEVGVSFNKDFETSEKTLSSL